MSTVHNNEVSPVPGAPAVLRRFLILAVMVAMLFSLTSCFSPSLPTRDEVIQQMLSHLQTKYGEAFTVRNVSWGKSWSKNPLNSGSTGFSVYPSDGNSEYYFTVDVDESTRPISFHDGYVGNLMEPTYQKQAQEEIAKRLPGAIVRLNTIGQYNTFPDDFTQRTTFDQFKTYADKNTQLLFGVFFPLLEDQDKASVEPLATELKQPMSNIAGYGILAFTAYSKDEFINVVTPELTGPTPNYHGTPGVVKFWINVDWKV
jgi:hypothetical protein